MSKNAIEIKGYEAVVPNEVYVKNWQKQGETKNFVFVNTSLPALSDVLILTRFTEPSKQEVLKTIIYEFEKALPLHSEHLLSLNNYRPVFGNTDETKGMVIGIVADGTPCYTLGMHGGVELENMVVSITANSELQRLILNLPYSTIENIILGNTTYLATLSAFIPGKQKDIGNDGKELPRGTEKLTVTYGLVPTQLIDRLSQVYRNALIENPGKEAKVARLIAKQYRANLPKFAVTKGIVLYNMLPLELIGGELPERQNLENLIAQHRSRLLQTVSEKDSLTNANKIAATQDEIDGNIKLALDGLYSRGIDSITDYSSDAMKELISFAIQRASKTMLFRKPLKILIRESKP